MISGAWLSQSYVVDLDLTKMVYSRCEDDIEKKENLLRNQGKRVKYWWTRGDLFIQKGEEGEERGSGASLSGDLKKRGVEEEEEEN